MADQDPKIAPPAAAEQPPAAPEQPDPAIKSGKRKRLFAIFAVVLVVVAIAIAVWQLMFAWRSVSTDNAYVGADVAMVTPLVSGQVTRVAVADTQQVRVGDILVQIDNADARVALARAASARPPPPASRSPRRPPRADRTLPARRPGCRSRRPISPAPRSTMIAAASSPRPGRSPATNSPPRPMRSRAPAPTSSSPGPRSSRRSPPARPRCGRLQPTRR
jgi:hypothetical protein